MLFSFIIPVYNCVQYLEQCISGICNIKLEDYEIILIDDGSTDISGELCDKCAKENRKIRCMHQKNKGASAARNRGLMEAKGDYVIFLDADDTIDSKKMGALLRKIEDALSIDIAFYGISFDFYKKGNLYRSDTVQVPMRGIQDDSEWIRNIKKLYITNSLSSICTKVFRREFLISNNLYLNEEMFLYEDLEYAIRCMAYGGDFLFEPSVIYHYRQSEKSGNMGRHLIRIEHIFELINQLANAFDQLIQNKKAAMIEKDVNSILLSLYIILAREKIAVSNPTQIKQICDDFACWYQSKAIDIPLENQKFADMLLRKDVKQLILKREYIKIRHKIAIAVKNTRIYQKLKG